MKSAAVTNPNFNPNIQSIMKKLLYTFVACLILSACGQTEQNNSQGETLSVIDDAKVQVYYFHGKQRCVTCLTVQEITEDTMNEVFGENHEVQYHEVDFTESANASLAEKYEIVFSSLVIASGENFRDITTDAFAMAIRNPEGLKAMIAAEVNGFLNQ